MTDIGLRAYSAARGHDNYNYKTNFLNWNIQ